MLRCGFQALHLGTAVILRRGFQALRLGYCSNVEIQVSTFTSWCSASGYDEPCIWNLDSAFWWLVLSDFWTVCRTPPKFSMFRGWLGRISKYFGLWLNSYFSWLDWQLFEILWAWSCLECDLCECTIKPFEAARNDHGECLDTQSRPPRCPELVVGVLLNRG